MRSLRTASSGIRPVRCSALPPSKSIQPSLNPSIMRMRAVDGHSLRAEQSLPGVARHGFHAHCMTHRLGNIP